MHTDKHKQPQGLENINKIFIYHVRVSVGGCGHAENHAHAYPEHDDVVAAVTLQDVEGVVEAGTGQEVVSLKPRAEVVTRLAKLEAERELQPLGLPTTDM